MTPNEVTNGLANPTPGSAKESDHHGDDESQFPKLMKRDEG